MTPVSWGVNIRPASPPLTHTCARVVQGARMDSQRVTTGVSEEEEGKGHIRVSQGGW